MLRRKRKHCTLEVKHWELKIVKKLLSEVEGEVSLREDHVEAEKAEELIIDSNKMNKKAIWPYEDGLLV